MLTTEPAVGAPTAEAVRPSAQDAPGGLLAFGAAVAFWVYLVVTYLRQRIILSFDTANNYAHVWYVADRIWKHGHLPLKMPVLGGGRALAFPYGFIPWVTAALFRPLLGDWVVGIWMVIGALGMIAGTYFAFPELRKGWWAAAVLINPALVEGLLFGQLTFEWAGAMVLFAVGFWRRDKRLVAVLLAGAGQATHPAIVFPMTGLLVAAWWYFEPDRRALVRCYLWSTIVALPAAVLVFASPTSSDASWRDIVVNFFCTLGPRAALFIVPMVLVIAMHHRDHLPGPRRALAPVLLVAVAIVNLTLHYPLRVGQSWRWLHQPARESQTVEPFVRSPNFVPNKTYRVLRNGDVKFTMYRLLEAGGRLDSEFFPESQAIRSFPTTFSYEQLLCTRRVDFVLAYSTYDRLQRTNEHALLRRLAAAPNPAGDLTKVRSVSRDPTRELFSVDRTSCPRPA